MNELALAISNASAAAGLSQRALAELTGISQSTLNRILRGERVAKVTEVVLIADATGCTVAQLTGSVVADRVRCVARATNGTNMASMRQRLLHFLELDAYLDDHAIPENS